LALLTYRRKKRELLC